jgi:hypothetical protein
LPDEGVHVLGILRANGEYVGIPDGGTLLSADDVVVLYGHAQRSAELDERRRGAVGDNAHARAVRLRHRPAVNEPDVPTR